MPICERCLKPERLCICASIRPIKTQQQVLILQHPQEPKHILGSAHMAHLCLPNSTLRVGLSWPNLKKALGRTGDAPLDSKTWGVLYLGSQIKKELDQAPVKLKKLKGIVVLDGTWSQAKALWWRNPWLLKLQRVVLQPKEPSLYRKLRKEPRKECLSTLESLGEYFELVGESQVRPHLVEPFVKLLEQYQNHP